MKSKSLEKASPARHVIWLLALVVSLGRAQFDFEWDRPCYDECSCNDVAKLITCYKSSSSPTPFIDLSFNRTNRTFTKLFFVDYAHLPAASFRDVSLNMNGTPSSPNRVLVSLKNVRRLDSEAFVPIGGDGTGFDNKLNLLDVDLPTPIDLEAEPEAFKGLKINSLTLFSIKLSSLYENTTYSFNLGSLYAASEINYLKLEGCTAISGFESRLTAGNIPDPQSRVLIKAFEISSANISQLNNRTLSPELIKIEQMESITWSSSELKIIDDYSFISMVNLNKLDLTSNQIKSVSSNTFAFDSANNLQVLDLTSNPIEEMEDGCFRSLGKLKQLSLRATRVQRMANLLEGLTSLEVFNFGRQLNLSSVNWDHLDKSVAPALKAVDLSYMASSAVVFNFSLMAANYEHNLRVLRSVIRLEKLYLLGYNFTFEQNSFCLFRPLQSEADLRKANMTLIYLNLNHACTCFPLLAFKYYRELNGFTGVSSSYGFLADAPRCLRELYHNASDIHEREASCEALALTRCTRQEPDSSVSSSTTSTTATSSTTTTTTTEAATSVKREEDSAKDNTLIAIIVSCSIGVVCIVLILVLIVFVCRFNYNYKLTSQAKLTNLIEQRTDEIERSVAKIQMSNRVKMQRLNEAYDDEEREHETRRVHKKKTKRSRHHTTHRGEPPTQHTVETPVAKTTSL